MIKKNKIQLLFIVNRKAGTDEKRKFPIQVDHVLNKDFFSFDVTYTQFRGHAIELAKNAAENGVDIVVAVGGDGSVNEVARGIFDTESALAIIPKGSGNGLARSLGIPLNTIKALKLINDLHLQKIDVGFANEHLFLSNAGVGFDALVARLFSENKGRGLLNYSRLVIKELKKYQPVRYDVFADGQQIQTQALFIVAANGDQFGYNFKIAPDAQINDGLLDICMMKPIRANQLPALSVRSFLGKISNPRFSTHKRCHSLTITAEEPLEWMQVDGDAMPVENNKVAIKVQPKKLKVMMKKFF